MRNSLITLLVLTFSLGLAQTPQLINYQGVVRDNTGLPISGNIGIKFEILQGSSTGSVAYTETQSLTTNALGLFNTQIGKNGNLSTVSWQNAPYFLKVFVDSQGGSSYTELGTQQMVNVPFAFHAQNVPSSYTNNVLTIGTTSYAISPTVAVTPPTSVTASGIGTITSVGTNTFDINIPAPNFTGTGATTITGAYPNYTVSSPALTATPPTTIIPAGIANVLNPATNSFVVGVQSPTFTSQGPTSITGVYPNLIVTSPTVPAATPNTSITQGGIINVTNPATNSFVVSAPSPTFTSVGPASITGVYPNLTITSPTVPAATPNTSITQGGIINVTNPATNSFIVSAPSPTFTSVGPASITGVYPNLTITSPTVPAATPNTTITPGGMVTVNNPATNSFVVSVPNPTLTFVNNSITVNGGNSVAITPSLSLSGNVLTVGPPSNTLTMASLSPWTQTGGTVALATTSNNVSIGGSNPTSKLEVIGAPTATASLVKIVNTSNLIGTGALEINSSGGNNAVLINHTGNIGEGITVNAAGGNGIAVNDAGTGGSDHAMIVTQSNNANTNSYAGIFEGGVVTRGKNNANNGFALKALNNSNSDLLVVRNDGNVGIGTNAPGYKLEVNSPATQTTSVVRVINNGATNNNGAITAISNGFASMDVVNTHISGVGIGISSIGTGLSLTNTGASNGLFAQNTNTAAITTVAGFFDGGLISRGKTTTSSSWAILAQDVNSTSLFMVRNDGNVGIGLGNPIEKLDINGTIGFTGALKPNGLAGTAGQVLTSTGPGSAPVWTTATGGGWSLIGNAGTSTVTNFIGTTDPVDLNFRVNNNRVGKIVTGNGNIFFGNSAGPVNSSGNWNSAYGELALSSLNGGFENAAYGAWSLRNLTSGSSNAAFGNEALDAVTTGNDNTALGYRAGHSVQTGNGNVFLGREAGYYETGSNKLYISNTSTSVTPLIYGDFSSGYVAIGTTNPVSKLHVQSASGFVETHVQSGVNSVDFGVHNSAGGYMVSQQNIPIYFGTNGAERMRITNTGNVGIGTANANAPLQFNNNVVGRKIVLWEGANNDNQVYGFGINVNTLRYQVDATVANHVFFAGTGAATSQELMRIQGNRRVGINNAAPTATLDVAGTFKLVDGTQGAGKVLTSDASGNASWQTGGGGPWTQTGGTVALTSSTSLVGIGNPTPIASLDIDALSPGRGIAIRNGKDVIGGALPMEIIAVTSGQTYGVNTEGRILRLNNGTNGNIYDFGIKGSGNFFLANSGNYANPAFAISTAGNIGFGIASPATNMHLNNQAGSSVQLRMTQNSNASLGLLLYSDNLSSGLLNYESTTFHLGTSGANRLSITSTGNVGIGTSSPGTKLEVNGDISIPSSNKLVLGVPLSGGNGEWIQNSTGAPGFGIGFYANGLSKMVLTNTGFLGINTGTTTAPTANLHVNGTMRYTDGNQAAGKVLTSDALGNATWQTSSGGWDLTGNGGTTAGANFIGTTDNQDLVFKTNSNEVFRATTAGNYILTPPNTAVISTQTIFTPAKTTNIGGNHLKIKAGNAGTGGAATTGGDLVLEGGDGYHLNFTSGFIGGVVLRTGKNLGSGFGNQNAGVIRFENTNGSNVTYEMARFDIDGNFRPGIDNAFSLGTSGLRWTTLFATNGAINTSDSTQKKNIRNLNYGLNEVLKMRPVKFNWKSDTKNEDKVGLIAQELKLIIPEVVKSGDQLASRFITNDKGEKIPNPNYSDRLGVFYSDLIPVLIKAIQEQQTIINNMEKRLKSLEEK